MSGRIRTLKPELLEDEKTAGLPDDAFRLFVSLILLADDYGNLRATPSWLNGQIWWCGESVRDVRGMLARLSRDSLVVFYEVNGQAYLHLSGWAKHQRVDKPGKPRVPRENREFARLSRDIPDCPAPDLRPPTPTSDPDLLSPRSDAEPSSGEGDRHPDGFHTVEEPSGYQRLVLQQTFALQALTPKQKDTLAALETAAFRWPGKTQTAAEAGVNVLELACALGGEAFPAVDTAGAVHRAAAWSVANPTKAKTPRGFPRFLTAWCEREQNRGGGRPGAGQAPQPAAYPYGEDLAAKLERAR